MKILHVASFSGNIGDNASHAGFKTILDKFIGKYEITELEIRKFYKNYRLNDKLRFDEDFLNLLKNYDLLIIGGGGFFDYWVPGSETGTTIDIAPEILSRISTPLVISSVGCMPHKQVPEGNVEKFRNFLDILLQKKNTFVAVRNDGSIKTLRNFIGERYADAIPEIVDHGFFYQNDGSYFRPFEGKYVAINSTSDQLNMQNAKVGPINHELYHDELRKVINHIISQTDLNLAFCSTYLFRRRSDI
ncbi:MAG: polysaccharide pyruvyl transferase family protein [Chitinophagaceae bacterium]|nr:polysaccharide pyruvyl transferase family protein [Chitinophagaceae bacterium]